MFRRAARPLALLGRAPAFRLVFLAGIGSGVGTWFAIVALNVDVLARTGSGAWLAALNAAAILPSAFMGLIGGPLVDRFSRKRLLVGSDLLRLGVFAALPFADAPGLIVALALVAGVGDAFFRPALLAGVPNLVGDDDLPQANFLLQASQWATTAIGPLVGGVLVAASSPDLAYWVNAASFGVSALLLVRVAAPLFQSDKPLSRGHWRDVVDGFSLVRTSAPLLVVFVVWNVAMVAQGAMNISEVVLAENVLDSGAWGYGLMWGATGVGAVFGGAVFARSAAQRPIARIYPSGIALFAAAVGLAAVAPSIWVAALAMVASGLGNGIAVVANITLVQRGAPDALRGRAFTVIMSSNFVVLGVAMFVAGPLTDRYGARWIWGGSAVLLGVAALAAVAMCRRLIEERAEPERPGAVATTTAG